LDEIHNVVDSKRGVHMMSAVERLVLLAGDFQRIALSATVHPPAVAAQVAGGYQLTDGAYAPRRLEHVSAHVEKTYAITIRSVPEEKRYDAEGSIWPGIANEIMNREVHFSRRIAELLEEADQRTDDPDFADTLQKQCRMTNDAAAQLLDLLRQQKAWTGAPLPHRHHVLAEWTASGPGGTAEGTQIVLRTMWGGKVNRPYAMALQAGWQRQFKEDIEIYAADDAVFLVMPPEIDASELLALVNTGNLEDLLRSTLEQSGFFGARFRECAQRALLLPRKNMRERTPLWLNRLRSQRLLQAISRFEDFPVLLETWWNMLCQNRRQKTPTGMQIRPFQMCLRSG
jgi:Lhr-like helicase